LFDVTRSCFRRWYVFLPLLLIVAWFSHSVYSSVKPVFYSSTVIGFAPPSSRVDNAAPGVALPRNGLLDVGGASLIANMTTIGLRDPSVYERVVAGGGLPYSTKMFPTPGGMLQLPMIMIEVTAADPHKVSTTLALVSNEADVTVRQLQRQAGVPDDQMVASFVVSPPSTPAAAMPSRTRSTVVIFGAGVGLSVLLTVAVDLLLTRRKSRALRRKLTQADETSGPGPTHVGNDVVEASEPAPSAEGAIDAR
jgi:hypothetical protein